MVNSIGESTKIYAINGTDRSVNMTIRLTLSRVNECEYDHQINFEQSEGIHVAECCEYISD